MSQVNFGVIGFGERARHMARIVCRQDPSIRLAAIADPQGEAIRNRMSEETLVSDSTRFYTSADEMLDTENLDGVIIGTRCSLHAAMGLKVLSRGIALFLEKPIATNMTDLMALRAAATQRVVVSFPLRVSSMVQAAREIIRSGKIGTVEHVQAHCNVPYGGVYYQSWYRDENETQGMFLQKASHDFDYINYLLDGNRPVAISAMTSKRVFRGNHPAGLHCMDCPERKVCFESPYNPSKAAPLALDQPSKEMCAFAVDTGNEDSGSALIQYESGMHVCYSQNFYARNKSAKRGATLIGYNGSIEFDWFTDTLKVAMHHTPRVETHTFDSAADHGGGDSMLAANFVQVMTGEALSISPLSDGLLNALMCLKAKQSAETHQFEKIEFPSSAGLSRTISDQIAGRTVSV